MDPEGVFALLVFLSASKFAAGFIVDLGSPDKQRVALLYMEAFQHIIDRDIMFLEYADASEDTLELSQVAIRSMLVRALDSEAVDSTTKVCCCTLHQSVRGC